MGGFWFYKMYTKGDVVKYTIGLIVLHILLIPIFLFGIDGIKVGSYYFIIAAVGVSGINIGYYIYALVRFIIYSRKYKNVEIPHSLTLAQMFMVPKEYLQK